MIFNKNLMDKTKLLKELDSLGYSDRIKKIAFLGLQHHETARYSELLSSLLEGGTYESHLALIGASVTRDEKIILSALNHPMASIRKRATGLLVHVASDEEIERKISNLSHECRRLLLPYISKIERQSLAERLLPIVYSRWGAYEASILLPACSKETVNKSILKIGYAIRNWSKLARRHLDCVADYFKTTLENAPSREQMHVWWRFSSAMETLCRLKPELILDCAINIGPMDTIHPVIKKHLGTLVQKSSDEVYTLLTRNESRNELLTYGVPKTLLNKRNNFSKEQWIGLAKLLADSPIHVANLLDHTAPSKREEIFEAVFPENERQNHIFPECLLYTLPHTLRTKEATRILGLREVYDNRAKAICIRACLIITEARETLQKASQASDADDRAMALVQLVKSTALSRQGVEETLLYLSRIKNEQDPVRCAVLTELSNCPASIFTNENAKQLTLLIDSAIEARDTSYGTRFATQQLAFRIMRHYASETESEIFKFALRTIKKLARQTGQITLPSLEENVPRGLEKKIIESLYPLVVEENKKENYDFVISLVNSLGKRGYSIKNLQPLLKEAIKAKSDSTARQATRLWLAPHKTRDARVKELLAIDKSFIALHEVFMHLQRKRQEWLDPFISGKAIKGRFLSGKTIYVVPANEGFNKWLPRQQESYGLILEKIACDSKRSLWERSYAIKTMARMPDFSPNRIIQFLKDDQIVVVEAALYALSRIEESEKGLPILLENLHGDRARVAMFALHKCLRNTNPELLTALLKDLLNRDKLKITVRKEAIRLLGTYKSSGNIDLLINEFEKNSHKDIIIAIGHAARAFLDNERGWEILHDLASSPQSDIAKSLLYQHPNELADEYRPRYLELIINITNHIDSEVGREAFNCMSRWTHVNEKRIATVAAKAIVYLDDTVKWDAAMHTLIQTCRDGQVNESVIGVINDLADKRIHEHWNANPQRDLPNRQRLMKLTFELTSLPCNIRLNLTPLFEGIIHCLESNETLKSVLVKFYVATIDWNQIEGAIHYLRLIVKCVTKQPNLLSDAYNQIEDNLIDSKGYWNSDKIIEIVNRIWTEEPEQVQFLALSLLEVVGNYLLWRADCADLIRLYRNHKNIEISALALDIWTAIE
jgi:hypothetical protein